MAERSNQNWEQRVIDSRGPKFRLDVNNPQMGADGANVYLMYAVNERTIEVVSGSKNSPSDVGVKISSIKGDIHITVVKNGDIRISGGNVTIQANEDISLKAGRNITLSAGSRILLRSIKVQARGLIGNLVGKKAGTWIQRIFKPTYVGNDYLSNPPKDDKFLSGPVVED
jgi:hypothetical protein